jgi:hypothetical protein
LTKEDYENLDYQLLYFVLSDSVPNWGSRNCGPDCIGNGIKGLTPTHHNQSYATVEAV